MSHTLTGPVETALASEVVPALLLIDLDFSSGAVRVNNSAVNFFWNRYPAPTASQTFTVDTGTDVLTLSVADTRICTGDAVQFTTTTTLPAPLAPATTYYMIKTTSATFKVAASIADAIAGAAIDLTTTGTGTHTVQLYNQLWLGLAHCGSVSAISETSGLEMTGVSMSLSGIPSAMITTALAEYYQGRDCNIWLAPLDANCAVLADPVLVFPGRIDTMSIELGDTASITLTAENKMADWNKSRVRRYTHEDQIAEYPSDLGLEFVPQMVEKVLVWGRS